MSKRMTTLTSTIVVALGLAAFAGSALAGNGSGNGNGNAAPAGPASAGPGNSASAPGQLKKDSATTSAKGSAGQNSASTSGIKPTSATSSTKHTHCSLTSSGCTAVGANAAAGMGNGDASKRYGSGRTAAEVARENGVTSGMLHGPGNSQPHKMALCPGGHEVDVHALKAKGQQNACAAAVTSPTGKVTPTSTVTAAGVPTKGAAVSASVAGGVQGAAASGAAPSGGVLGVTASGKGAPAGGVLGAIAAVGEGALPFTGFPLWVALLLAVGLAGTGLALRRHARATV